MWDKKRAQADLKFIISEAETIWPPREVNTPEGFSSIEQSNSVKTLLDWKASLNAIDARTGRMAAQVWFKRLDATINAMESNHAKFAKKSQWDRILRRREIMRSYLA